VVAFPAVVLQNSGIQPGDLIGAFTMDGLCAGRQEIQNIKTNHALNIFGDDALTSVIDGFEKAEPFHFKVYRPEADEVFDLDVTYELTLPNVGYFAENGISAVSSLKLQATGLFQKAEISIQVYPNPSKGIIHVQINQTLENPEIQITDFRGGLVRVMNPGSINPEKSMQFDLSILPKGVYFLRLQDEGFVDQEKIIIQ
jgi:hypothetical protein